MRFVVALLLCLSTPGHADGLRCIPAPYHSGSHPALQTIIDRTADVLAQFPSMQASWAARAPEICLDDRAVTARGYLDAETNRIALRADLDEAEAVAILIHELRHLEHLDRGFCPSLDLSMSENARATMAVEADAQAVTALIAWSVQDTDPEIWQAVLGFEKYADIAQRLDEELARHGNQATAVARAFDQWFVSDWRRSAYYQASCSDYLARLDETKLLPSYDALAPEFLDRLCLLPDGESYACTLPPPR